MSRTIIDRIQRTAARRQAVWANGCDPWEIEKLTNQLEELYAEQRLARARRRHGDRTIIIKRARIDRELERLIAANPDRP